MKTLIYASLSLNGQVLLAQNNNHQIPQKILSDFIHHVMATGNLVIGRKTAELLLQNPAVKKVLSGVQIVILSKQFTPGDGYTVVTSPQAALDYLHAKGFTTALLGGGPQLYNAFILNDLIDELIININPLITGNGGLLLQPIEKTISLLFTESRPLTPQIVQLKHTITR